MSIKIMKKCLTLIGTDSIVKAPMQQQETFSIKMHVDHWKDVYVFRNPLT